MSPIRAFRVTSGSVLALITLFWASSASLLVLALLGLVIGALLGALLPLHPRERTRQRGLGLAFTVVAGPLLARWISAAFGEQTLLVVMLTALGALSAFVFVIAWRVPEPTRPAIR